MTIKCSFTDEQFDDLVYACREAQIRFARLRKDPPAHFDLDEIKGKIEHYSELEFMLRDIFKANTGRDW